MNDENRLVWQAYAEGKFLPRFEVVQNTDEPRLYKVAVDYRDEATVIKVKVIELRVHRPRKRGAVRFRSNEGLFEGLVRSPRAPPSRHTDALNEKALKTRERRTGRSRSKKSTKNNPHGRALDGVPQSVGAREKASYLFMSPPFYSFSVYR